MTSRPHSTNVSSPSAPKDNHGLSVSRLADRLEELLVGRKGQLKPPAQIPTKSKTPTPSVPKPKTGF